MPLKDYQIGRINGNFVKTKIFPTVCWEDTLETTPLWNLMGTDRRILIIQKKTCMDPFRYLK